MCMKKCSKTLFGQTKNDAVHDQINLSVFYRYYGIFHRMYVKKNSKTRLEDVEKLIFGKTKKKYISIVQHQEKA